MRVVRSELSLPILFMCLVDKQRSQRLGLWTGRRSRSTVTAERVSERMFENMVRFVVFAPRRNRGTRLPNQCYCHEFDTRVYCSSVRVNSRYIRSHVRYNLFG